MYRKTNLVLPKHSAGMYPSMYRKTKPRLFYPIDKPRQVAGLILGKLDDLRNPCQAPAIEAIDGILGGNPHFHLGIGGDGDVLVSDLDGDGGGVAFGVALLNLLGDNSGFHKGRQPMLFALALPPTNRGTARQEGRDRVAEAMHFGHSPPDVGVAMYSADGLSNFQVSGMNDG